MRAKSMRTNFTYFRALRQPVQYIHYAILNAILKNSANFHTV
jgi:hypothetical protein